MTVNQRFEKMLEVLKILPAHFAKKVGTDKNTVGNILSGKTKLPKADLFISIAKFFPEINLRWLLLGEGEMFSDKEVGNVLRGPEPPPYGKKEENKETGSDAVRWLLLKERMELIERTHLLRAGEVEALRAEVERLKKRIEELDRSKKA
jgi:transcriptional regulator with XRE-family HTH domain